MLLWCAVCSAAPRALPLSLACCCCFVFVVLPLFVCCCWLLLCVCVCLCLSRVFACLRPCASVCLAGRRLCLFFLVCLRASVARVRPGGRSKTGGGSSLRRRPVLVGRVCLSSGVLLFVLCVRVCACVLFVSACVCVCAVCVCVCVCVCVEVEGYLRQCLRGHLHEYAARVVRM